MIEFPTIQTQVSVIIPAAGRGSRLPGEEPKQYRHVCGRPLLWHTLKAFEECPFVAAIIVALHPDDESRYGEVVGTGEFSKIEAAVHGGEERCDSVQAALRETTEGDDIVLVHDAVRPLVSCALIERVILAAEQFGAAVPAQPAKETIKEVLNGVVVRTPDRSRLWTVQTPQGFRRDRLLDAYRQAGRDSAITDEAMLVERAGWEVRVVDGEPDNFKLTTPDDVERLEWMMRQRGGNPGIKLRVGQGYDVHRLVVGKPLVLGGVELPYEMGLMGHSDADVLTHAIIDALLGAAALGDIGRHFPDSDERYRDISSLLLLENVRELLISHALRIVNVDTVVIAEAPKLSPHVERIRQQLADTLRMDVDCISVKATTTEGLGFVGREEGIIAQAFVQIEARP